MADVITVLVGVRRGAVPPDSITALWKDEHVIRVDLAPFSPLEVADLVSQVLDGPIDTHSTRRLVDVTGGNALYLRHLVEQARHTGALHRDHDVWIWDGRVEVDPALNDLIDQQLGSLRADEHEALVLIALGEPLTLRVCTTLLGIDIPARLEAAGLVRVGLDGDGFTSRDRPTANEATIQLAQPMYREAIRARAGPLQRRQLLTRLADAHGADDVHQQSRVASWRLDAGAEMSGSDLVTASLAASDVYDFELAERLAQEAAVRSAPASPVALATALIGLRRFSEAAELLAQTESEVLRSRDEGMQRRHLMGQYLALYQGLGDDVSTAQLLERFAPHFGDLARALGSNLLIDRGQLAQAQNATRPVLDAERPDSLALMISLENTAEAAAHQGNMTRAQGMLDRLRALAEGGEPLLERAPATASYQTAMCKLLDGHVGTVIEEFGASYVDMLRDGDPVMRGLAGIIFGASLIRHGHVSSARQRVLDAVAAMSEAYVGDALPWALAILSQAQALAGEGSAARASLAESRRLRLNKKTARLTRDFVLAEAFVAMVDGRRADAVDLCLEGAARSDEFVLYRAELLHSALRFGAEPIALRQQLDVIAASVESPLVWRQAEHAAALASDDADALLRLASQWADDGALLEAAEAGGQAAAAFERHDRRVEALLAEESSRGWWDRCEGIDERFRATPSLSVKLSSRETEVISLAATGLHNSEIAERLVLSVRTVESHLYSAFSKIGISRRADLPVIGLVGRHVGAPNEGHRSGRVP